jgi:hypothetical protein
MCQGSRETLDAIVNLQQSVCRALVPVRCNIQHGPATHVGCAPECRPDICRCI